MGDMVASKIKQGVSSMLKKLLPSIILIIIGSLSITFSMTKQLDQSIIWIIFVGGTILNILGIGLLYLRFQQLDQIELKK